MAKKELMYKGFLEEELKKMSMQDYMKVVNSRERRALKRGFTDSQKALLSRLEKGKTTLKTHSRDMVIVPKMLGKTIKVYSGKEFVDVNVDIEKLGKRLGEFVMTRKTVKHGSAGIGASKSSKNQTK